MPREVLERLIIESVRRCPDLDLLDLIYRLLIQNAEQLHDSLKLSGIQLSERRDCVEKI